MDKFLALTEEKRLTILNAAFQCFGKFGYEKASMSILLYYAYRRKLSKKTANDKLNPYPNCSGAAKYKVPSNLVSFLQCKICITTRAEFIALFCCSDHLLLQTIMINSILRNISTDFICHCFQIIGCICHCNSITNCF